MAMLSRAPLYLLHRRGVCWQLRYRCVGTMLGMPPKLARLLASIPQIPATRRFLRACHLQPWSPPVHVSVCERSEVAETIEIQGRSRFVRPDIVYHASSDTVGAQLRRIVSVRAGCRAQASSEYSGSIPSSSVACALCCSTCTDQSALPAALVSKNSMESTGINCKTM